MLANSLSLPAALGQATGLYDSEGLAPVKPEAYVTSLEG